jgi:hypothetical protein
MEQDSRERAGGTGQTEKTGGTGKIEQGNRNGSTVAGHSVYGTWDRTAGTGQHGQGRTERTSQDMTATLGHQRQESRGQDSWDMIAGTGQLG